MPFRSFSDQLFCSVPVNAHGRVVASRKRRFTWEIDGCAWPCAPKLKRCRWFGIDKELPSRGFRDFGNLGAGGGCEKGSAKNQRSQKKPCRACCAFRHGAFKEKQQFRTGYDQFSTCLPTGQCLFRTRDPCQTVYPGEIGWRVVLRPNGYWRYCGPVRPHVAPL